MVLTNYTPRKSYRKLVAVRDNVQFAEMSVRQAQSVKYHHQISHISKSGQQFLTKANVLHGSRIRNALYVMKSVRLMQLIHLSSRPREGNSQFPLSRKICVWDAVCVNITAPLTIRLQFLLCVLAKTENPVVIILLNRNAKKWILTEKKQVMNYLTMHNR